MCWQRRIFRKYYSTREGSAAQEKTKADGDPHFNDIIDALNTFIITKFITTCQWKNHGMIQFYRSYTSYVIMILAYTFLYLTMISNTRLKLLVICIKIQILWQNQFDKKTNVFFTNNQVIIIILFHEVLRISNWTALTLNQFECC